MKIKKPAWPLLAAFLLLGATSAAVAMPTDYGLLTTIALPTTAANTQPGGAFTAFDISFVDPVTGDYYVADRSNASVDIINGASLQVLAQAGGFSGQQKTTSVSGPDGVLVVDNGTTASLFAGNGNSTLRSFNVTNPASPVTLFAPISTGGVFRVDEMSYSPSANLVLAANNAETTPFATLVNASTGAIVKGNITIPNTPAGGGLEQSVWDPKDGDFLRVSPGVQRG